MPTKKSAAKHLRQSQKKVIRNAKMKKNIKLLTKNTLKSLDIKNQEDVKKYSSAAVKSIDKAIQKGVLKKNTGARKKSFLIRKVNAGK